MTAGTPTARPTLPPDAQKTQKLLDLVKGDRYARSEAPERDEVLVWPHLVVIEAIAAAVFLVVLTVVSILVRAPLRVWRTQHRRRTHRKRRGTSSICRNCCST
jgi:hypothetical protein